MTARTWIGGGANLATDPNNWSPTGIPQLGDTLTMAGGTMDVTGDDLAGDTLAMTGTDVINVTGSTAMALETSGSLNATVNLAAGSVWSDGISGLAIVFGPVTVQGEGVFNNLGPSIIGASATINVDVSGAGSFQMGADHNIAQMEFGKGVSAGQTIVETGSPISGHSQVRVDDPADFQAAISLSYSEVVLLGLTADSYTFANGVVTLWSGQTVVDTVKVTTVDAPSADFFPALFGVSQVIGGINIHDDGANFVSGTLLGLHVAPADPTPAPPTPAAPTTPPVTPSTPITPAAAPTNFTVTDTTTGTTSPQPGTPYSGPVAGLTNEIVMTSPDSLNITATTPNSFIHTGAGNDAISVASGNNVLDGSTGSNFLSGGSGADTFFVDDRGPGADIWSSVVGFHSGDTATIWGVSQAGFTINWLDGQGAAGFSGLTAGFSAPGHPNANITFAGYTSADLAPGGRLSVSFGATADQPGAPGSAFMMVHGT